MWQIPDLLRVEVLSVIRHRPRPETVDVTQAEQAVTDLLDLVGRAQEAVEEVADRAEVRLLDLQ